MTLVMYALIESRVSWYGKLLATDQERCEIEFWTVVVRFLNSYNSLRIWHKPSVVRIAYSGAIVVCHGGILLSLGRA